MRKRYSFLFKRQGGLPYSLSFFAENYFAAEQYARSYAEMDNAAIILG